MRGFLKICCGADMTRNPFAVTGIGITEEARVGEEPAGGDSKVVPNRHATRCVFDKLVSAGRDVDAGAVGCGEDLATWSERCRRSGGQIETLHRRVRDRIDRLGRSRILGSDPEDPAAHCDQGGRRIGIGLGYDMFAETTEVTDVELALVVGPRDLRDGSSRRGRACRQGRKHGRRLMNGVRRPKWEHDDRADQTSKQDKGRDSYYQTTATVPPPGFLNDEFLISRSAGASPFLCLQRSLSNGPGPSRKRY